MNALKQEKTFYLCSFERNRSCWKTSERCNNTKKGWITNHICLCSRSIQFERFNSTNWLVSNSDSKVHDVTGGNEEKWKRIWRKNCDWKIKKTQRRKNKTNYYEKIKLNNDHFGSSMFLKNQHFHYKPDQKPKFWHLVVSLTYLRPEN